MKKEYLSKFYKKSHSEKLHALKDAEIISSEEFTALKHDTLGLPKEVANRMIENYLLNYELPFGIALNFIVDGKDLVIPMVTEEPSIVAASSNAGKLTGVLGGFETEMKERLVIGQVVLKDVPDSEQAARIIKEHETEILDLANAAHPSILNYGGGARRLDIRTIADDPTFATPEFFVVHILVDTAEAMGANIVNTMSEAVAPYVVELVGGTSLMNILSNYATESIATATCRIAPAQLATGKMDGETVRDRIIEATHFAQVDPYRAVTHNKGIMNGIDSVLVATGNDWRAVEAGVHAYAARDGQYRSLTKWSKDENGHLKGEINLPISVGSVGGTLSVHPTAKFAYDLLGQPNANELSRILAAVGLAQNLTAVKALVTEGIQKGHMSLQAQALAIRVGAQGEQVEVVAQRLKDAKHMNSETAKKILEELLAEKSE